MPEIYNTEERITEANNKEGNDRGKYSALLALFYTVLSCAAVIFSVSGVFAARVEMTVATGIAIPFLTMLLFYLYLHSLGENANKGALAVIIPVVLCPIIGYMTESWGSVLYAVFGVISPTVAAAAVYIAGKTNGQRSSACASASFLMLVFTALETVLSLYTVSREIGVSIGTILFDSLSEYIEKVKLIYIETMNSATSMLGTQGVAMTMQDAEFIESMLATVIALTPALMCAINFFYVYIFTRLADRISTVFGITEKPVFGRFEITGVTNIVFNIAATVIMFSILFESGLSPFTCGVLSVLIVVLPGYLILGTRRIFGKLTRVLSKGVAAGVLILIYAAGFVMSYYLLLLIISFFGTSEYRAARYCTDK